MNEKNRTFINSNTSPPPYRLPPELQELLNSQGAQRRREVKLPKRNWIERNPRIFQLVMITASLFTFFSKPLYDLYCNSAIASQLNELDKKSAKLSVSSDNVKE